MGLFQGIQRYFILTMLWLLYDHLHLLGFYIDWYSLWLSPMEFKPTFASWKREKNRIQHSYITNKCSLLSILINLDGCSFNDMCSDLCSHCSFKVYDVFVMLCSFFLCSLCCSLLYFSMGVQEVELPQIIEDSLILSFTESSYLIRLLLQPSC